MKKVLYVFLLMCVCVPRAASAHQPRIVDSVQSVAVQNPEISQAFYGELTGTSTVYTFTSGKVFILYANLMSPVVPGAHKDFSAAMYKDGIFLAKLAPEYSPWDLWYEEFAGDDYFRGPEFRATTTPGVYEIRVDNDSHSGKYVLAIGEIESFPFVESVNTIARLPALKAFFGKPWYAMFEGKIGNGLVLGGVAIVIMILGGVWVLITRYKR